jgi:hypothetical protein
MLLISHLFFKTQAMSNISEIQVHKKFQILLNITFDNGLIESYRQ